MYKNFFKPTLDFLVALIGLLVLSPIFLFVMIALAIANNGKPFFFQKRPGKNEKIFSIIKFKSMNDKKDAQGNLLPDAQRLTRIGAFVRKTSLDEIPQLINVLKGDMSLIGPRPLLVQYLPYYTEREKLRHTVRPVKKGLIFHSDQGVQYATKKFTNVLESYGVIRSMSRKGNCWDNAVAESFFKSLKTELIYGNKLVTKEQMEIDVFEYIEIWYNKKRRHRALNYKTIEEFNNQNQFYKNVA